VSLVKKGNATVCKDCIADVRAGDCLLCMYEESAQYNTILAKRYTIQKRRSIACVEVVCPSTSKTHSSILIVISARALSFPSPHHHASNNSSGNNQSSHDGGTHHSLLCNLVIDQTLQAACLQIRGLQLEQQLIISSCLGVVTELVVSESEVVQTLAPPFSRVAKDFRE
jgi:hypothetical protein